MLGVVERERGIGNRGMGGRGRGDSLVFIIKEFLVVVEK